MSTFIPAERRSLEHFLDMTGGYVLSFSDRTFGEFVCDAVGVDIHAEKYSAGGTSKANKLRTFWSLEPEYAVGTLPMALIEHAMSLKAAPDDKARALAEECRSIATRLITGGSSLDRLREHAKVFDANHLAEQIRRMEASIETDPSLAIGTAKELIETCCKTILAERGKPLVGTAEVSTLTKATLKELRLVPEGIPDAARGADIIKRLLSNLGTIGNGLADLRGLYGTGHGKHASTKGLGARHAKLAVGAAATLVVFLFETHKETKP